MRCARTQNGKKQQRKTLPQNFGKKCSENKDDDDSSVYSRQERHKGCRGERENKQEMIMLGSV